MVGNKDMYCQNKIVHTIQAGDSLYKLSRQYHTTVTELILGNPGVNPYNLQIGMQLFICPGEGYVPPQNPGGGNTGGGTGNAGSGTGNTGSGNMSGGTGSMGGNMGGGTGNAGASNETESEREGFHPPSQRGYAPCMVKSCLLDQNVPDECSRRQCGPAGGGRTAA